VLEYAVAVVLSTWALWIVDPVSRLGEHFFLGRLFSYEGPGFWFGLPLGSQVGFAATSAVLVGILTWLARDDQNRRVPTWYGHPHWIAVGGYVGQVVFMGATALVVGRTERDPEVVATANALAGAAVIVYLPLVLVVALQWRQQVTAADGAQPTRADSVDLDRPLRPVETAP
jgi:hypothetical protein